jgi:predicted MFS family arabinose efflux permease
MNVVGRLVDRYGPLPLSIAGTLMFLLTCYFTLIEPVSFHPAHLLYIGFMMATSTRNVAFQTSMSRIPKNHERARYLSLQSAFQHAATAAGAIFSAQILTEDAGSQLVGFDLVTIIAMGFSAVLPFLMLRVDKLVLSEKTSTPT